MGCVSRVNTILLNFFALDLIKFARAPDILRPFPTLKRPGGLPIPGGNNIKSFCMSITINEALSAPPRLIGE